VAIRFVFAASLIGWSAIAVGQITGDFYLEKSTFAPGEPVFLYFRVANDGGKAENLHSADPYSFCSGYEISLSSDPKPTSSCPSPAIGGSCLSSSASLKPGGKHVERLLLNYDHKIDAPGEYSVEATRQLSHATEDVDFFSAATPKDTLEVRTTLYFRVEDAAQTDSKSLQRWVGQLRSADPMKRLEAARTLASLAPKSLEDTLLTFVDSEFQQFAPLAFHRLNTPRSMAALADLLKQTQPGTYEHMKSADYLADSNDLRWLPLLLETAERNARIGNYVLDAARLGGDKALPTLITLAGSTGGEFTRINAISALGYTGSRAAVPILLDYLRSRDTGIAERAVYGLRLLTHRTARDADSEEPWSQYPIWASWWVRDGSSATIYKSEECGDFVPLQ